MEQQHDTFREYGYSFQIKIIAALLTDRQFLGRSLELLKTEFFEGTHLQWISKTILSHFQEYKELPTLEVFKSEIVKQLKDKNELLKSEIVASLRDIYKNLNESDLDYIKSETLEFAKNQKMKKAILNSVEHLKNGKFDAIQSEVEEALRAGNNYEVGLNIKEDVDASYTTQTLERITTGWPALDDLTGGGVPKGKLAIIIANLGAGKTFLAVHLGAAAAEAGFIVLHYTLELSEAEVGQRYHARMTGVGMDSLVVHMNTVKSRIKNVKGVVYVKEFLSGVTLHGIEAHLDQCRMLGIIPDLVIIDYDELIDIDAGKDADAGDISRAQQLLYRQIRRKIANGRNCVVWMPAQATSAGADEDVVRTTHSAGSYGKNRESDLVITLSRKDKDKLTNTARVSIQKSRLGPDGITLNADFNTSTAQIKLYREETTQGKKQKAKMVTDETFEKQYMATKYDEMMNSFRKEPEETDLF